MYLEGKLSGKKENDIQMAGTLVWWSVCKLVAAFRVQNLMHLANWVKITMQLNWNLLHGILFLDHFNRSTCYHQLVC